MEPFQGVLAALKARKVGMRWTVAVLQSRTRRDKARVNSVLKNTTCLLL